MIERRTVTLQVVIETDLSDERLADPEAIISVNVLYPDGELGHAGRYGEIHCHEARSVQVVDSEEEERP